MIDIPTGRFYRGPVVTSREPSTERGEETRRRIIEAAAAAFAGSGYAGTSLNDLIRSTGLTKGAFYFHFESKEHLALEVFRAKQESWFGIVMSAGAAHTRALDQATAMLEASIQIHGKDPSARVVSRLCWELSEDAELAPLVMPFMTTWVEVLASMLRRAQDEGDVKREIDVDKVAYVAVSGFIGIIEMSFLLTRSADLAERARDLMDVVLLAIRP